MKLILQRSMVSQIERLVNEQRKNSLVPIEAIELTRWELEQLKQESWGVSLGRDHGKDELTGWTVLGYPIRVKG